MPLSLLAVGVAVLVFFRMNASGQFDDDEGPAWSVVMDDDRPPAAQGSTPGAMTRSGAPPEPVAPDGGRDQAAAGVDGAAGAPAPGRADARGDGARSSSP